MFEHVAPLERKRFSVTAECGYKFVRPLNVLLIFDRRLTYSFEFLVERNHLNKMPALTADLLRWFFYWIAGILPGGIAAHQGRRIGYIQALKCTRRCDT
jgi:hypothetical protein